MIGFYPGKLSFYDIAFTHRSASRLDTQGNVVNNERLEYLGDAILGAVIADFLYNRFPQEDEGFLTKMRSKLVNRAILTNLTYEMGLNVFIDSNANNAIDKSHIYGDVLEALIGAIYLDRGYDASRYFIIKRIIPRYIDLYELEQLDTNFKSKLIEWSQKNKKQVKFETQEEYPNGSKQPKFVAIVEIDDKILGKGTGSSKKEAQQNAARNTLEKMGVELQ
ncbi:MAG: ribonuclease III [Bacteroidota bacterium]